MPVYIVRTGEIGQCVQETIDDLNLRLWEMNQRGHSLEMPKKMQFDMIVVKEWEAIQSTDRNEAITSEIHGGFQTESRKSDDRGSQSSNDTKQSRDTNSHGEKGSDTQEFYDG